VALFNSLPHDLLILGASCRAAAFSALRAGFHPRCADYFADRDLAAVCPVDRVDSHHAGQRFTALAETLRTSPWFYTGGLENHPDWVDQIARRHHLWGIGADTLRAVRDPIRVALSLTRRGLPRPSVSLDHGALPRDGTWLVKPLRSAGGRGINPLTHENDHDAPSCYFQERITGPSYSALYIGRKLEARLVGVTRQLIGMAGSPFAYRGSIGPLAIPKKLTATLIALGNALASDFGLVGWFGVDYILHDGDPWPVEINPRYPASLEIHELATGQALLLEHRRACEEAVGCTALRGRSDDPLPRVVGKLILYAQRSLVAPEIALGDDPADLFGVPAVADIPWPGTCVNPGEPVMTIMATGENIAECRSRLVEREREWRSRLEPAGDRQAPGRTDRPSPGEER
jgi:predicted ATP-grasp superfamily ATP-dependent carboligase